MDLPLLETLINYKNENNVAFSMPGNKDGQAFKRDSKGKEFIESLGSLDITEVEPLDNLHHPEGVIKEIAKRKPLRAVFRDSGFKGSPEKINVGETFKLISPDTRVKII